MPRIWGFIVQFLHHFELLKYKYKINRYLFGLFTASRILLKKPKRKDDSSLISESRNLSTFLSAIENTCKFVYFHMTVYLLILSST